MRVAACICRRTDTVIRATSSGYEAMVQQLLEMGKVDVNVKDTKVRRNATIKSSNEQERGINQADGTRLRQDLSLRPGRLSFPSSFRISICPKVAAVVVEANWRSEEKQYAHG
jgi:hypothetical protein